MGKTTKEQAGNYATGAFLLGLVFCCVGAGAYFLGISGVLVGLGISCFVYFLLVLSGIRGNKYKQKEEDGSDS